MFDFKIGVQKRPFFISIGLCILMEALAGFSDSMVEAMLRFTVCCIFSYCIYRGMQEKFMINPYFLFSLTPLSLLLYSENLSTYYLDALSNKTWLLGIINMIAFIWAFGITKRETTSNYSSWGDTNIIEQTDIDKEEKEVENPNESLHALILTLLGITPVVLNLFAGISIPFKSIIGFFLYLGIAMAFKTKKKSIIIICLIISMLNFVEDFNKTRMLYLAMTVLVSLEAYYIKDRKGRIQLFCLTALAGLFILIVSFPLKSFFRSGGSYIEFFNEYAEISDSAFSYYDGRITFNGPSVLMMPYMYLIQGWNNLQYVMETQNTRTFGLWLLKPLLGYFQIDGRLESLYELIPSSSFNTFTYISVLFKDFGYWGSVIGSAFLGFYVKRIYVKLRRGCSSFDTGAYALVGMATLEMFFSNHFFSLSYPFTVVIIGYIYKKVFSLK